MVKHRLSRLSLLLLSPLFAAQPGQTAQPQASGVYPQPGYYNPGYYNPGYQFRQPRRAAPARRAGSGSMGSSGSRPASNNSFRPRQGSNRRVLQESGGRSVNQPHRYLPPELESSISDPSPWIQQSLLYKIRITSSGDLKTVVAEPPEADDIVIRQLGEAVTTSDQLTGQTRFITEFRYLLMPLKAGEWVLPPAKVHITRDAATRLPTEATLSDSPITLKVKPPVASVVPWLPLYDLRMKAELSNTENPAVGQPMQLSVETTAFGATAAQIPSIAAQLKKGDFRVYQDKTQIEEGLTRLDDMIYGRRTEHFTLVPRYGGNIDLPAIELRWWNTRFSRAETSVLPARRFVANGTHKAIEPWQNVQDKDSFFSSRWLLLPLILVFGFALYQWYRFFLRGHRINANSGVIRLPGKLLKTLLGGFYAPLARWLGRLAPRRVLHEVRRTVARFLPVSWRLWFCMRALARENDPAGWAQAIQILGNKHLGIPANASLRSIGQRLAACHPAANGKRVAELMLELEKAVYGSSTLQDFQAWKLAFNKEIRPHLFNQRLRQCRPAPSPTNQLPALNPGAPESIQA